MDRRQSRGEEIANSISHGVGLALALAGAPVLIVSAARHGTPMNVVGLAYTGGVAFYVRDGLRYRHFLWHLCVLGGTACHYFAVLEYAW